jgi:hypothetical protein
MINRIAVFAIASMLVLPCTFARAVQEDTGQKSDEIMSKIFKLDMMNFLLPLAMKKEQYAKVLPVLEKVRRDTKLSVEAEAQTLRAEEAEIDAAIKDCFDKGLVPKKELRDKLGKMLRDFSIKRQAQIAKNIDAMYNVLKDVWTPTQMKIASESLNPKDYDSDAKVEEMTEEDKSRIFIREIMLNPAAYEVMVKLSM